VAEQADQINLHASAVAFSGRGCLITGASGSGKSTLAIELIALGAGLVCDDRADVRREAGALRISPPLALAGLIEARGAGLITMPHVAVAELGLIVELDHGETERLPLRRKRDLLGISCPVIFGRGRSGLASIVKLFLLHGVPDPG